MCVSVLTYQISSFYNNSNKFQTGGNFTSPPLKNGPLKIPPRLGLIRKLKQLSCSRSGKRLIRTLVPIPCPRSATVEVESFTIFHVREVENA